MITEPTRVTISVTISGVIHVVFMMCTIHHGRNCPRTIEIRQLKHFQKNKFLSDLEEMPWSNVDLCSDPNDMWQEWKQMFASI